MTKVVNKPAYSKAEFQARDNWSIILRGREQTLENLRDIQRVSEQVFDKNDEISIQKRFEDALLLHAIGLFAFSKFEKSPVYFLEGWFALQDSLDASGLYYNHWDEGEIALLLDSIKREVHRVTPRLVGYTASLHDQILGNLDNLCGVFESVGKLQRQTSDNISNFVEGIVQDQRLSFSVAFGEFWSKTRHRYDWQNDMFGDVARFKEYQILTRASNLNTSNPERLKNMIEWTKLLADGVPFLTRKQRFVDDMRAEISTTVESMFCALQGCDRIICEQFIPVTEALTLVRDVLEECRSKYFPEIKIPSVAINMQPPRILTVESFLNSYVRKPYELRISLASGVADVATDLFKHAVDEHMMPKFQSVIEKQRKTHLSMPTKDRLSIDTIIDSIITEGVVEAGLGPLVQKVFGPEFIKSQEEKAKRILLMDYPQLKKHHLHQLRQRFEQTLTVMSKPGALRHLSAPVAEDAVTLSVSPSSHPTDQEVAEWWPVELPVEVMEDLRKSDLVSPVSENVWSDISSAVKELRLQLRAVLNPRKVLNEFTFAPALVLLTIMKRSGDDVVLNDMIRDINYVAKVLSTVPDDPIVSAVAEGIQAQKSQLATLSYKLQEQDYETVRSLMDPLFTQIAREINQRMPGSLLVTAMDEKKLSSLFGAGLHALELFDNISTEGELNFARAFRSTIELLRGNISKEIINKSILNLKVALSLDSPGLETRIAVLSRLASTIFEVSESRSAMKSRELSDAIGDIMRANSEKLSAFGGGKFKQTAEAIQVEADAMYNERVKASELESVAKPEDQLCDILGTMNSDFQELKEAIAASDTERALTSVFKILRALFAKPTTDTYVLMWMLCKFIMWIVDLVDMFNDIKELDYIGLDLQEFEERMDEVPLHRQEFRDLSIEILRYALGDKAVGVFLEYLSILTFKAEEEVKLVPINTVMQQCCEILASNPYETRFDLGPLLAALTIPGTKLDITDTVLTSLILRLNHRQYASVGQLLREIRVKSSPSELDTNTTMEALRCLAGLMELFGNTRGTSSLRGPDLRASLHLALSISASPFIEPLCPFEFGATLAESSRNKPINGPVGNEQWEDHVLLNAQASTATFQILCCAQRLRGFIQGLNTRRVVLSIVNYSTMRFEMLAPPESQLFGSFGKLSEDFFEEHDGTVELTDFMDVYVDPTGLELAADLLKYADQAADVGRLLAIGEIAESIENIVEIVGRLSSKYVFLRIPALQDIDAVFGSKHPIAATYANASFELFEMRQSFGNVLIETSAQAASKSSADRRALLRKLEDVFGFRLAPQDGKTVFEINENRLIKFVRQYAVIVKQHAILSFEIIKSEHFEAMKDVLIAQSKKLAYSSAGAEDKVLYPLVLDRVLGYLKADVKDDLEKLIGQFMFPLFEILLDFAQQYSANPVAPLLSQSITVVTRQWEAVMQDLIQRLQIREKSKFQILNISWLIEGTANMVGLAMGETEKLCAALRDDAQKLSAAPRTLGLAVLHMEWLVQRDVIAPIPTPEALKAFCLMADEGVAEFFSEPVRLCSVAEFMNSVQKVAQDTLVKYPGTLSREKKQALLHEIWETLSVTLSLNVDLFFDEGFYVPGFFNNALSHVVMPTAQMAILALVLRALNLRAKLAK
eukprot:c19336_g1_i2.p1 GENE.c19336_g1_i2~~c19336_g1_i2.p1  ORF type:complete len:1700 (+),score=300.26 c19336_g1_i2:215-5101(+)